MRYEYTITKEGGEAEIIKAMSWKKLSKSLLLKYPEFSGWCTYINKKGHVQVKRSIKAAVNQANKVKKLATHCAGCGCTPKPDEWSTRNKKYCFDCA